MIWGLKSRLLICSFIILNFKKQICMSSKTNSLTTYDASGFVRTWYDPAVSLTLAVLGPFR